MARPTGAEALEDFEGIERRYAQGGHEACGEAVHTQLLQLVGATRARMRLARWQDLPRWPQGARHSSCLNKRPAGAAPAALYREAPFHLPHPQQEVALSCTLAPGNELVCR